MVNVKRRAFPLYAPRTDHQVAIHTDATYHRRHIGAALVVADELSASIRPEHFNRCNRSTNDQVFSICRLMEEPARDTATASLKYVRLYANMLISPKKPLCQLPRNLISYRARNERRVVGDWHPGDGTICPWLTSATASADNTSPRSAGAATQPANRRQSLSGFNQRLPGCGSAPFNFRNAVMR